MRLPIPASLALVLALVGSGCFVFDESLYLRADAGPTGGDGGPPPLALADDCSSVIPRVELAAGAASAFRTIDTTGLSNDYANLGCTGRPAQGPDGLFQVDMVAGERWHFHVRRRGTGADPVIFVFRGTCEAVFCDRENALDACRVDSDEHLSIRAASTGPYFIGIDSGNTEGFVGSVEIFRPICGDGIQQHGESCEPGADPLLTCDDECHVVLAAGASEHEVNDDSYMANQLAIAPGETVAVGGRIGALCENDVYRLDALPAGTSITARLLTAGGGECPVGTPSAELQLVSADGIVVLGTGTVRAGACPSIEATDTFAQGLGAGRYHLRIYALNPEVARPFDYSLRVTLSP
jgi:hypothetical protein